MDLSSSVGAGGGHPHLSYEGLLCDGGLYQVATTPPPLLLHNKLHLLPQHDSALKLSLYPGLMVPTVYPHPHQALMMPPNIPTITHLPLNYVNLMPPPQHPQPSLRTGTSSQLDFGDLLKTSKRKINQEDGIKMDLKKAKVETRALKAKRPGFTDERYNETTYFFENGLRKVNPYYFTFTTFTKGRWVGETILEVFSREFRAQPEQEYVGWGNIGTIKNYNLQERCINAGTLTVNFEKVETDYRLKHNDLLANIVHRHEVPVSAEEIKIISKNDDLVVVNKPPSIPVHPCGRYRHNTVVFILAKDYGLKNLRTIHRLDRLTSGLLMFGRNPGKAREMETQIRTRQVRKEYVCRVEGEFPVGVIQCKESLEVISYKIGVCRVSSAGKECHTEFQRLSSNGASSVVLCRPLTGRMHQIRVHLQYLGHPVINDPLYNHAVFGPNKGKGGDIGKSEEQLVADLIDIHNSDNWLGDDTETSPAEMTSLDQNLMKMREEKSRSSKKSMEDSPDSGVEVQDPAEEAETKAKGDPHCYECKVKYRDPSPSDLMMFLHALRYQGNGWSYETELPYWASPDWVES